MQLALPNIEQALTRRFRLPPAVPPFNTRGYRLFSVIWLAAFLLAFVGPLAGFYYRYTSPANNSQLLLGSRAGFAVAPRDATRVRFIVGPQAEAAGTRARAIGPGDERRSRAGRWVPGGHHRDLRVRRAGLGAVGADL